MGNLKSFLFGLLTAYGLYYITRKGPDGRCMLDDMLEHPEEYLRRFEKRFIIDMARTIRRAAR